MMADPKIRASDMNKNTMITWERSVSLDGIVKGSREMKIKTNSPPIQIRRS